MADRSDVADQEAFTERLRVQLRARYPEVSVEPDPGRFGLRATGPGLDARLALTPLWTACRREPGRTSSLIADFVRQAESSLTPAAPAPVSLGRLMWCVRTDDYLREHTRSADLLTRPVAGNLVAFVAESLPNSIMQGLPRQEWEVAGAAAVSAAAHRNTAARFAGYAERIRTAERIPRDGWSLKGDVLFMGSILLVPEVLRAAAGRAGGDVLLAHPDRELVLAIPASADGAGLFRQRVTRAVREALNPVSRDVLRTDGESLTLDEPSRQERAGLFRRLLS